MMAVGLHPRLIGQARRTNALMEFIEHCQSKGKVSFAGRDDIANLWIEQFG